MAASRISRSRLLLVLVIVLALAGTVGIASSASAKAPKGCTNATVKGEYGFVQTGAVFPNGVRTDWAAVGRNVFDGNGSFTIANATLNIGGTIVRLTGSGTYAVSPDCTMTLEATLSNGQINHRDIVVVDGGREMFTISTDSSLYATGRMVRQSSED